jgi:hypothetical protein
LVFHVFITWGKNAIVVQAPATSPTICELPICLIFYKTSEFNSSRGCSVIKVSSFVGSIVC